MRERSRSPPRGRSRSPGAGGGGGSGGEGSEVLNLEGDAVAYILGREGSTKRRLQNTTGCRLEIGTDTVEIVGTDEQRALANLCIEMTLQQRKGRMTFDFQKLGSRPDCDTFDVPKACVGFVLGQRGATLRNFEEQGKMRRFARSSSASLG